MAVSWNAATSSTNKSSGAWSFTHTPTGGIVPRGIALGLAHGVSTSPVVTAITYGGVALSKVVTAADPAGEPGLAELWFVGSGLSSGAQTVSLTKSPTNSTVEHQFVCMSFDAAANTEVLSTGQQTGDSTNVNVALTYGGRTGLAVGMLYGGSGSSGDYAPNSSCTALGANDFGAFVSAAWRQTTPGSADFNIGGVLSTLAADDLAFAAMAIAEVAGGGGGGASTPTWLTLMGVS